MFLNTGVSSGFDRAFSEAAIAAGHRVIGTVRRDSDRGSFEMISPAMAHAVVLDVTDVSAIESMVASSVVKFGRIDALFNNAGYSHEDVLEESPLEAMRNQFEVNVFGVVAMIKAVPPGMRVRRSGHIINMSVVWSCASSSSRQYWRLYPIKRRDILDPGRIRLSARTPCRAVQRVLLKHFVFNKTYRKASAHVITKSGLAYTSLIC